MTSPNWHERLASGEFEILDNRREVEFGVESSPGSVYVVNILDKFPGIRPGLANRLGEANWQRNVMIRSKPISFAGIHSSAPAQPSEYTYPLPTARRPRAVYGRSKKSKLRHVPAIPISLSKGSSTTCTICSKEIKGINTRVAWK